MVYKNTGNFRLDFSFSSWGIDYVKYWSGPQQVLIFLITFNFLQIGISLAAQDIFILSGIDTVRVSISIIEFGFELIMKKGKDHLDLLPWRSAWQGEERKRWCMGIEWR